MEYKFQSTLWDPVNGNDFIRQHMGSGVTRKHKHCRAFFAVADPLKTVPDRKSSPLFKVQKLVRWLNYVSWSAVNLGRNLAIDEQTISFQGRHMNKLKISYKAAGDGFQCDAICQQGFTHVVFFRQEPAPKKYLDMGLSPLHSRVMWLCDQLKERGHRIWMDNLYLSTKLCRVAYTHHMQVLIAGVTRKSGRGLPRSIKQEEAKNREAELAIRGTVKVAVLKGDAACPNVVAASVYDTKPVHFLSTIAENIAWVLKEKQVYNVDTQRTESLRFLRLNINDSYNNDMGHTDVADQLRNNYKFDHWFRNYKWWWSIMMWGVHVLLVNAYIVYKDVMVEAGRERFTLSQYQFRRLVAIAWVSSDEPTINELKRMSNQNAKVMQKRMTPAASETGPRKRRKTTPQSTSSTDSKSRAPKLTDVSIQGKYSKRLDAFVTEGHFPVHKPEQRPKCALHKWAADVEERKHVYSCSHCKISLCVSCFPIFHKDHDLVNNKEKYKQDFKRQQAKLKSPPSTKK